MNRKFTGFQMLEGPRNAGTLIVGLLLCWAALSPLPASGATYQVKRDGTGDFTTIQAAIDVAVDGDVILVHPGTYYENIRFEGKNITLRSLDPEDDAIVASTVIDGGQNGSVVRFAGTEDERCELSGLTITNGQSDYGGGIHGGRYHAGAVITGCTISGNGVTYFGGGLYRCSGPISNCTITGNSAAWGGGLFCCIGTISNCTINGNSAYYGGGLCDCWAISNCTIISNSAGEGGGVYGCDGIISRCTINDNSASESGGGLYLCYCRISNCTISGNSAEGGGGLARCMARIRNCTISGNSAPGQYEGGGGLYRCTVTISNCTAATRQSTAAGFPTVTARSATARSAATLRPGAAGCITGMAP